VTEGWLLGMLEDVERTATAAISELAGAVAVVREIRVERAGGLDLVSVAEALAVRGGPARRSVAAAFQDYEHAVAVLRGRVIRTLVDDHGVTLSALARRMGLSRQAVARLYNAG